LLGGRPRTRHRRARPRGGVRALARVARETCRGGGEAGRPRARDGRARPVAHDVRARPARGAGPPGVRRAAAPAALFLCALAVLGVAAPKPATPVAPPPAPRFAG